MHCNTTISLKLGKQLTMNDGEELLGKADALLSRYKSSSSHQEVTLTDFPVLTEVVEEATTTVPPPSEVPLPSLTAVYAATTAAPTIDQELQHLEEKLRQGVLSSIEPQLTSLLGEPLETRIREHLGPAFDRLVAEIANAAREETAEMVRQAVSVAVEREISELQARVKA